MPRNPDILSVRLARRLFPQFNLEEIASNGAPMYSVRYTDPMGQFTRTETGLTQMFISLVEELCRLAEINKPPTPVVTVKQLADFLDASEEWQLAATFFQQESNYTVVYSRYNPIRGEMVSILFKPYSDSPTAKRMLKAAIQVVAYTEEQTDRQFRERIGTSV